MSQEPASDEAQTVALGVQSHCLPESCRVVFYCYVLKCNVRAAHSQSECSEGADGVVVTGCRVLGVGSRMSFNCNRVVCRRHHDVSMVVPCDDGCEGVLAANLYVGEVRRNFQFFLVSASFYVDYLVVVHECAAHLDGLADVAELSRAVACHHYGVGVVVFVGSHCCCSRQGNGKKCS